jgi:hypothetical protein
MTTQDLADRALENAASSREAARVCEIDLESIAHLR